MARFIWQLRLSRGEKGGGCTQGCARLCWAACPFTTVTKCLPGAGDARGGQQGIYGQEDLAVACVWVGGGEGLGGQCARRACQAVQS